MMAAESGGLPWPRSKDVSLKFSAKPNAAVYLPSLNCIVGTVSDGFIEVLDIHSGCLLRKVNCAGGAGSCADDLLCTSVSDGEKVVITKGNVIGCRGILGEKILLDSILQHDTKEKNTLKIELDIVQAGILLNGLQACQRQISSPKQFATIPDTVKVEEDIKAVTEELQKQYERSLRAVKDFANKAVKWMTVCIEMEKTLLSETFVCVYSIMSRQMQDPSLPIIGDVLRRISLCNPPKKKNELGRVDRIMMLGEVERLETFKTWPHKNYEYALPGPMAEAGFYHPTYSTASEDRAICFKCDICLVYWEPSDQPWSEHERHSSSCPFVKGEFTANVPLSVCAAVCHAQSLNGEEKVKCIGDQSVDGMVLVGTNRGNVYLWDTNPLLKVNSKLQRCGPQTKSAKNSSLVAENGECKESEKSGKSTPVDEDGDSECDSEENKHDIVVGVIGPNHTGNNPGNHPGNHPLADNDGEAIVMEHKLIVNDQIEDTVDDKGSQSIGQEAGQIIGGKESKVSGKKEDDNTGEQRIEKLGEPEGEKVSEKVEENVGHKVGENCSTVKQVKRQQQKTKSYEVEIQALTLATRNIVEMDGKPGRKTFLIIGRKCSFIAENGSKEGKRASLSILVVDKERMKAIESKQIEKKPKKMNNGIDPSSFPNLFDDPLFPNDFEPYVPPDTGELSVINEYLRATKKNEAESIEKASKEKKSKHKRRFHEFDLPDFVNPRTCVISHIYAAKSGVFVVVKNTSAESTPNETIIIKEGSGSTEELSSLDSDTEVIEMPVTDTKTNESWHCLSYILQYGWTRNGSKLILNGSFIGSRLFAMEETIADVILISSKNLGFQEQRYDIVGEKVCVETGGSEVLVAALGRSQKKLVVMSTIDMTYLSVIPIEGDMSNSSTIHKLVDCVGMGVVACCFDDGNVLLCHLEGQAQETEDEMIEDTVPAAAQALEGPFTDGILSNLMHLTKFEPIKSGVHAFLPMEWMVGRATHSVNAPLQSKKRLHPHVQDIYPINSPSLGRGGNTPADPKLKEKRFRSGDQMVSFKILVSSETSIGYLDLAVECTSAICEDSNVLASLYMIEENLNEIEDDADEAKRKELLCGPIALWNFVSSDSCKAAVMLTTPKLLNVKSSYLALDLEYKSNSSANEETESACAVNEVDTDKKNYKVAIADFISNVQIVVYQSLPVIQGITLPVSCRKYLIENTNVQERLIKHLIASVHCGNFLSEDSEARKCLELVIWIWNILTFADDSVRLQLAEVIEDNLANIVQACFMKGDRTLAHRIFQLIVSISRFSKTKGYSTFLQSLLAALIRVMDSVASFASVGALRWFFRLCNAAVTEALPNDVESLLYSMLASLAEITKFYKDCTSHEQMFLQTKFDVVGSPLEPIIAEPIKISIPLGESVKLKTDAHERGNGTSTDRKVLSIPASDMPGILEVHQLGFVCMMTSEGSKCEKISTANDSQGKSLKVNLEPQNTQSQMEFQDGHWTVLPANLPNLPMPMHTNEDLPFLCPKSLYDDLNSVEAETSNADFDVLDDSMFQFLEAGNFVDVWTPGMGQRRPTVVKKKGRVIVKQDKAPDIENEFIIPESMILVVERMHAAAQHFAVIDFQRPINLTDVIIPPCASLASISIYAWKESQTEKEATHVMTSHEISQNALILTDIIPTIRCKYLKIIANGSRKLNSTKVSIALGNFYGRPTDGTYMPVQLQLRLQQQYDRMFCRYALACDRLINAIEANMKKRPDGSISQSEDSRNKVIKAYADCSGIQLSLNHVFHSMKFYEAQSTSDFNNTPRKEIQSLPLDHVRVLIESFAETLLLTLQNVAKQSEKLEVFGVDSSDMSLDHFLGLFKSLCVFGPEKIRVHSCMLLQCICAVQPWWNQFLIQAFKYCFEDKSTHGVPKNRLFDLFMRLLKTSTDLNVVLQSFTNLLKDSLSPLCDRLSQCGKLDLEMIDWILLVFNELLQHFDQGDWTFLAPWNAIARESNSLESRTQEHIRSYLQEQRKKLSTFHKKLKVLASTAKKKYSTMVLKIPEETSSSKELKDLLMLRRHPLFNKRKSDKDAKGGEALDFLAGNDNYDKFKNCCIEKQHVLPTVNLLMKLMLISRSDADFERLILTCKIASLLTEVSDVQIHLREICHTEDLSDLLLLSVRVSSPNAAWINHAVLCFLSQILFKKEDRSRSPSTAIIEETSIEIPVNLDLNSEKSASNEQSEGSSGDSSGTMSGQEGEPVEEKLTDIASSIATNLMKVIKESVSEKKGSQGKEIALAASGRCSSGCSTFQLMDGFDKGFQMEGNRAHYENCYHINEILIRGICRPNVVPKEQPYVRIAHDEPEDQNDFELLSNAFARITPQCSNSNILNLVLCHWLAVNSSPDDTIKHKVMQLHPDMAKEIIVSREFSERNRYFNFLYEMTMLSAISIPDNTNDIPSFLQGSAISHSSVTDVPRSLSLLNVFINSAEQETIAVEPTPSTSKDTQPEKPILIFSKNVRRVIKRLMLDILNNASCIFGILRQDLFDQLSDIDGFNVADVDLKELCPLLLFGYRNLGTVANRMILEATISFIKVEERDDENAIREMLNTTANAPIFDTLDEDEIEITYEILILLASTIHEFVIKNKDLILLSNIESNNTKRKRIYYVDKGRQWQVGKSCKEEKSDQFSQCVVLIEKMIYAALSNSVSGSQLLEKIYGKKSQILQNLIDILLLVGDPSVKKEPKPDFPLALLPKQDPCQGKSEFHPVVETVYRMLLRLGQNMIDRPRILELTLSFFENKDTPCYFISKALKCVMKNLLQYDTDVALFVERDGLSLICDRINYHADSLKWGSNSSSDLSISQALTSKERPEISKEKTVNDIDGSELKNLAPCGRITSPPNSPPADILLQSKPMHRRSRFAAWSYQFTDDKEEWINLTIDLPFAILLKQVIICPHQSFLGNCPAEVYIEIKGCGETYIPHSPNLQTCGLQMINIFFAKGLATKAIRINMKRPLDSDVIKLNVIELFGKAAITSTNSQSVGEFSRRFFWVELLDHILMRESGTVNHLEAKGIDLRQITKSILIFLRSSNSRQHVDSDIIYNLMIKIFANNFEEWKRLLTKNILPNNTKLDATFDQQILQPELACKLITVLIEAFSAKQKSSCLSVLMDWAARVIQDEQFLDQKELQENVVVYMECIARTIEQHVEIHDQVDRASVVGLTGALMSVVNRMDVTDCRFKGYTKLVTVLSVLDENALHTVLADCNAAIECNETWKLAEAASNALSIASMVSQNEQNSKLVIAASLPPKICSLLQSMVNIVSNTTPTDLRGYLASMHSLLQYLINSVESSLFQEWLGSVNNSSFLRPLIQFLSMAYLDKCLLSKDANERDLILSDIHKLQSTTIRLIKGMVLFNPANQIVFVSVIKSLLFKETRPELSLINNSFLKRLVLQLILEEDEVDVYVKRLQNDTSVIPQRNDPPQSRFKNMIMKRLRVSDTLGSIFPIPEKNTAATEVQPKQTATANEYSAIIQQPEDWLDDGDWADLYSSAKSAAEKRHPKPHPETETKKDTTDKLLCIAYYDKDVSKEALPHELTIGQLMFAHGNTEQSNKHRRLSLYAEVYKEEKGKEKRQTSVELLTTPCQPSLLHVFAADGGIQLLAEHSRVSLSGEFGQTISTSIGFVMKFVPLAGFSNMFLNETKRAEYLLRLMLGVEENSDGDPIAASNVAAELPLLPFIALQELFKSAPLDSTFGQTIRKDAFDRDIIKLLLNHLGALCYQETTSKDSRPKKKAEKSDMKPSYWARGTGFGTGSTASTWDVEKVMHEKQKEEDHVVCLFRVLANYIDPTGEAAKIDTAKAHESQLPDSLTKCLEESPIRSVLSNYLRNDSVLDMARHVPLFVSLMEILRALVTRKFLIPLLLPKTVETGASAGPSGSISQLLSRLKDCADTYIKRLKGNKRRKLAEPKKETHTAHGKKPMKKEAPQVDQPNESQTEITSEALTILIGDIQETSRLVDQKIRIYQDELRKENDDLNPHFVSPGQSNGDQQSLEDKYMQEMKTYQFDTFEFVSDESEDGKIEFLSPFHYAETIRTAVANGDFSYSSRARRLAQEIASLSTSLPLSYSSSVFLRCDENRLDLMKVLITGPEDTPYANGCFEFDVYFPHDYPTSPMMVNLQTNGQHSIRFNPNLYNDGKVCLSILNTWHGRPEEKWNPQTSNLLQVLVSIQSLILVPDPYFNEPGYERSRGTPTGQQNSMDYNANIKQATMKWAMLEQMRNPSPCFKKIIRRHFIMKKTSIIKQCETWISQMKDHSSKKKSVTVHYEAMKRHLAALKGELEKLTKDETSGSETKAMNDNEVTNGNEATNDNEAVNDLEDVSESNTTIVGEAINENYVEMELLAEAPPQEDDKENLVYV